jgi:hypothetical protein
MTTSDIIEVRANGEDIYDLIQLIEPVLVGHTKAEAVIAMLSMVLSLQHPNITPEERADGVKEISRFICLWLDGKGIPAPTGMVN